jgi:opacity protein-like surface antigen
MKKMQVLTSLLLLGAAAMASAADNGFYFGATGGQASYDFDRFRAPVATLGGWGSNVPPVLIVSPNPSVIPPPAFGVLAEPRAVFWIPGEDEEATSWSALVGYRFTRYVAVELAYHDLGTLHEYSPPRVTGPITTIEVKTEMESTGATLSLLGQLPITEQWSVYLRAGGLFADQDVSRRVASSKFDESYDSEVFLYGIGTQFDFGAHWSVRLDFQRFDDVGKGNGVGEADVDALTLGVLFRLGTN